MRRKRSFYKKSISTVLIFSMICGLMTGCGKNKNTDDDSILSEASKASKDYVFKAETMDVGIGDHADIRNVYLVGDRVYVSAYTYSDNSYIVCSFNTDGSDVQKFSLSQSDNESYGDLAFDDNGDIYILYSKYFWDEETEYIEEDEEQAESNEDESAEEASEEDGEEETTETEAETGTAAEEKILVDDSSIIGPAYDSEDQAYLVKFDKNGNKQDMISLKEYMADGYFSSGGMVNINGTIVISSNFGLIAYTKDAGLKPILEMESDDNELKGKSLELVPGSDGKLYVSYYSDDDGKQIREFDIDTKKFGEPVSVGLKSYVDSSFLPGNGYTFYLSTDESIFGFDVAKNEKVKLLNYIDSDIQVSYSISNMVALSDKEFIAVLPDEDYNYHLERLTKVPASEVKDKKIITLGGYYVDYSVRTAAVNFNKNSDEYKIKIVDYSSYDSEDDYGAGSTRFNLDIASGNVPDIMLFGVENPVDSYINKGLFLDLTDYFAKDPDISEEDLLPNVVEACKTNGKLYKIIPSFFVTSVITKTKYLEGKETLSFKDCEKLIKDSGADKQWAFGMQTRNGFLETGLALSGNKYIDWENKKCNFNSDSFIEFLEYAANLKEDFKDEDYDYYKESFYRNGKALFHVAYVQEFRYYKRYKQAIFGDDISFIGFPNDMGVNCSVLFPEMTIAISARSANKDGAWSFVKTLFSEEAQNKIEYNFPVRKSSFERLAQEATKKPYWMDGDKKEEYDDTYYLDDQEIIVDPLTQEELKELEDFIGSVTLIYSENSNINAIIEEEASAFFSGQKSAQEVADIIQSRLTIYVNENS
ncbi:ABC transporter substrate-binding protein [Butyrivibrio sp. MC2021]|uniref:ABC transporter substrate-binding protein n=1 Tax=Butyrivibrio sp. MC2021 TaxID=1408306 RepID=UPI000479AABB|nr:ABC transporter substrate-binding protein [Butyrivibrio sp. MC2021]